MLHVERERRRSSQKAGLTREADFVSQKAGLDREARFVACIHLWTWCPAVNGRFTNPRLFCRTDVREHDEYAGEMSVLPACGSAMMGR